MPAKKPFTERLLKQFDKLTWAMSDRNQVTRITARLAIGPFIEKHGKAKCELMFAELKRREKAAQ